MSRDYLLLRLRQVRDEIRKLHRRRALRGSHVMAAGRDAGAKAFFQRKPKRLPKAESRVEMISRSRADLRLLHEGSVERRAALARRRRGRCARVHYHASEIQLLAD